MIESSRPDRALIQTLERLAELGVIPDVAPALRRSAGSVETALREAVLGEVTAFTDSRNPQILPDLRDHAKAHVAEVVRLFEGETCGDLAFVSAHARRRAEQRFPLEATLHAYRCGHRAISRWLRDAAASICPQTAREAVDAIADFAIEYTNVISAVMTSDYVAHTRLIEAAEGDLSAELLNILLAGYDESDGRIGRLLKSTGYLDQRQSYCVVGVRTPIAVELDSPERAQRLLAALANLFAPTSIQDPRGPAQFPGGGDRIGVAPAVGLDGAANEPGRAPGAASLAARSVGHRGGQRRSPVDGLDSRGFEGGDRSAGLRQRGPAGRFLLGTPGAQPAAARGRRIRALGRAAVDPGLAGRGRQGRGALAQTLQALADADLNIQKAGRRLDVHPNTIYARLQRIRDATGLDGKRHHDLVELLLAVECARI